MYTLSFPGLGLEFQLNPVAIAIGNLSITWYGILISVGMLLAMVYAFKNAKKYGIIEDKLVDVVLVGVIFGLIGARLYYVAFKWDYYSQHLSEIYKTWEGGIAIYGGVIGAFLAGALMCRIRKVRVAPTLDLAAQGFLIGQAIGRWGNFVNIEAFGSNTTLPWGMTSSKITAYLSNAENVEALTSLGVTVDPSAPVHPCFLYESIWCALGFLVLWLYSKHRRFDGEIFLFYLIWYGLGRSVIEGLRTDSLLWGKLRVSQVLAIAMVVVCFAIWAVLRTKIQSAHDPAYRRPYGQTQAFSEEYEAYQQKLKNKAAKKKEKRTGAGKVQSVEIKEPENEAASEVVAEPLNEPKDRPFETDGAAEDEKTNKTAGEAQDTEE